MAKLKHIAADMITLADAHQFAAPLLYSIPVKLPPCYVALLKGVDVDQLRNLA